MFINFVMQEDGEDTKILQYEGSYTIKDLEKIFLSLIDPDNEWLQFQSPPNGFITRKKYIRTVYLKEGQQENEKK